MLSWVEGKKTYLLAGAVVVLLGAFVAAGALTPELALDILVFSAPCFAATFRSAIQTHHNEVLATLVAIAEAGVDLRAHNSVAAGRALEAAAETAGPFLVDTATTDAPKSTGILSGGYPFPTKEGN